VWQKINIRFHGPTKRHDLTLVPAGEEVPKIRLEPECGGFGGIAKNEEKLGVI